MTTRDPVKKEMAEQKKEARMQEAEGMKHEARAENAATRREQGVGLGHGPGHTTTTGMTGHTGEGPLGGVSTGTTTTGARVKDPRTTAGGHGTTGYGSGPTY